MRFLLPTVVILWSTAWPTCVRAAMAQRDFLRGRPVSEFVLVAVKNVRYYKSSRLDLDLAAPPDMAARWKHSESLLRGARQGTGRIHVESREWMPKDEVWIGTLPVLTLRVSNHHPWKTVVPSRLHLRVEGRDYWWALNLPLRSALLAGETREFSTSPLSEPIGTLQEVSDSFDDLRYSKKRLATHIVVRMIFEGDYGVLGSDPIPAYSPEYVLGDAQLMEQPESQPIP